jgi:hypothetical protein
MQPLPPAHFLALLEPIGDLDKMPINEIPVDAGRIGHDGIIPASGKDENARNIVSAKRIATTCHHMPQNVTRKILYYVEIKMSI